VGKKAYPLRLDEELRKMLEETSASEGTPMSQLIREGVVLRCSVAGTPSSAALRAALALMEEAAALLRSGQGPAPAAAGPEAGLLPCAGSPPRSWDAAMLGEEAR
jgi:hypothetical protein